MKYSSDAQPASAEPPSPRRWAGPLHGPMRSLMHELFPAAAALLHEEQLDHGWRADGLTDYCRRCGATVAASATTQAGCPFCVGQRVPWETVTRLSGYVEPMRAWLLAMKFEHRWRLCEPLGRPLAEAFRERGLMTADAPKAEWVVTPVPLHWRRRAERGYNQAELLADEVARQLGLLHTGLIQRERHTAPQSTLSTTQRQHNVRHAFAARRWWRRSLIDVSGWSVILVDDVKTTGSTLAQCTRVLRDMGAREVHVVVAAVADPRGQDFSTV